MGVCAHTFLSRRSASRPVRDGLECRSVTEDAAGPGGDNPISKGAWCSCDTAGSRENSLGNHSRSQQSLPRCGLHGCPPTRQAGDRQERTPWCASGWRSQHRRWSHQSQCANTTDESFGDMHLAAAQFSQSSCHSCTLKPCPCWPGRGVTEPNDSGGFNTVRRGALVVLAVHKDRARSL